MTHRYFMVTFGAPSAEKSGLLKRYPKFWRIDRRVWLIGATLEELEDTEDACGDILDELEDASEDGEFVAVIEVSLTSAAASGVTQKMWKWISTAVETDG